MELELQSDAKDGRSEKARRAKRAKLRLPAKERENFSENLALMLKSAVPVGEALESLAATSNNKQYKKAIAGMQEDVDAGYSLADTLERSGIVGEQTLALVRLGESSGRLVENLQLAAKQEEKQRVLTAKVRSALIYPVFVVGLTVIVGVAVAWFLLPRLAVTFAQMQVDLPFISKIMIAAGDFLRAHGVIAVPLAAVVIFLIGYFLFVAPRTRDVGRRLLFRLPGSSRLIREVEVSQFGYLLGELLDAGLPITNAVKLLGTASAAPDYRKFYRYLAESLEDGNTFKGSLLAYERSDRLLTPAVQQMVIAGERSGSLPDILQTVGRTYEQKADVTTQNLEAIIEPALLVVVALGVLMVAVAIILPIYSLVGGLNQ